MDHHKKYIYANPDLCHGSYVPDAQVGRALAGGYQHLKNWRQHDTIARYAGPPLDDYCGGSTNEFYIISAVTTPADTNQTTRKLGIHCKRWNYDWFDFGSHSVDYENNVNWNGSQLSDYKVDIRLNYNYAGTNAQDDSTAPAGPSTFWIADPTQSDSDSQYDSGYRYDLLSIDEIQIANLSVQTLPEWTLTTAASQGLVQGNFSASSTLRGWTSDTDTGTSVGAMVHNTDNDTDGILQNTKRCIMNWMHPAGCLVVGSSVILAPVGMLEYDDGAGLFRMPFKTRGRNLRNRAAWPNDNCDVVMVAQWDAGTTLQVGSTETNDFMTYPLPGTASTPTMVVINDAFRHDPTGDTLWVRFNVSNAYAAIVHSISVFEITGDEV